MPQFTKETAAEMARRSHSPDSARNKPAEPPQEPAIGLDYTAIRLMRVRKQLDRLDELASEETDPKRCKEFADATSRLQEQERQLAGRPLPGTLKPSSKAPRATQTLPEPTPIEPTPTGEPEPNG